MEQQQHENFDLNRIRTSNLYKGIRPFQLTCHVTAGQSLMQYQVYIKFICNIYHGCFKYLSSQVNENLN